MIVNPASVNTLECDCIPGTGSNPGNQRKDTSQMQALHKIQKYLLRNSRIVSSSLQGLVESKSPF